MNDENEISDGEWVYVPKRRSVTHGKAVHPRASVSPDSPRAESPMGIPWADKFFWHMMKQSEAHSDRGVSLSHVIKKTDGTNGTDGATKSKKKKRKTKSLGPKVPPKKQRKNKHRKRK